MTDTTKRETGRAATDANAAADRPQGERAPCREREARGDQTAAAHDGLHRAPAPSQTDRTPNAISGDTPERRRLAPPCNAARARAAMEALRFHAKRALCLDPSASVSTAELVAIEDVAFRALCAPPRNCDLYATLAEAVVACGLTTAEAPALSGMGAAQLYKFAKWLYAPASEGGAR